MEQLITVTPGQVRELRHHGNSYALWWDGKNVVLDKCDAAEDASMMFIDSWSGVATLAEDRTESGDPVNDENLAEDLTYIANDSAAEWPLERLIISKVMPIAKALSGIGLVRCGAGYHCFDPVHGRVYARGYRNDATRVYVSVTVGHSPGVPLTIRAASPGHVAASAQLSPAVPPAAIAAFVVAATGSSPGMSAF